MEPVKKSLNILFYTSLLLPQLAILLFPQKRDMLLACLELGTELILIIQIGTFSFRQKRRMPLDQLFILLTVVCLFLADTFYNGKVLNVFDDRFWVVVTFVSVDLYYF